MPTELQVRHQANQNSVMEPVRSAHTFAHDNSSPVDCSAKTISRNKLPYPLQLTVWLWMLMLGAGTAFAALAPATSPSAPLAHDERTHLHVQTGGASERPPDLEVTTVGPNEQPNFRSAGYMRAPLLEIGFDLSRARLETRDGQTFPAGRQFLYLQTLQPPGDGLDRSRILERLDLSRLRSLNLSEPQRMHVLLVKTAGIDTVMLQYNNPDFTIDEIWNQPDTSKLEGPWTVWVDSANIVTNQTTIAAHHLPNGQIMSASATPQYACVQDGHILGSISGYWPASSDDFVTELFEDCMSGDWGEQWNTATSETTHTAIPTLVNEDGAHLTLQSPDGNPFILIAPAPEAEPHIEIPTGSYILTAVQPDPAKRVIQVKELLADTGVDAQIMVIALPYARDQIQWSSTTVATKLREALDVPVYEDQTGEIMKTFAPYLSRQNPILLINSKGTIIDAYIDLPTGDTAFPGYDHTPEFTEILRNLTPDAP